MGQSFSQSNQSNNNTEGTPASAPVSPEESQGRSTPSQRRVLRSTSRALRLNSDFHPHYQRPPFRRGLFRQSDSTVERQRSRTPRRTESSRQLALPMNNAETQSQEVYNQGATAALGNEDHTSSPQLPLHSSIPSSSMPSTNVHNSNNNNNNSSSSNGNNSNGENNDNQGNNRSASDLPTMRMITEIIAEAVMTTFREHLQLQGPRSSQHRTTMELDSDWVNSAREDGSLFGTTTEEFSNTSFVRIIQMPVIITTHDAEAATNQESQALPENHDGSSESNGNTRVHRSALPVVIYGRRTSPDEPSSLEQLLSQPITGNDQPEHVTNLSHRDGHESVHQGDEEMEEAPPLRRSTRIRNQQERLLEQQRVQQQEEQRSSDENVTYGRWVIYIVSGTGNELGIPPNFLSESASYEDLLALANLLGPVRPPTTTLENIDTHIPAQAFSTDVKNRIVGNKDRCTVCLESFASLETVRVLDCQHGFHKTCIDKWLTEGQNRCPLCRDAAVPDTTATSQ